MSAPEVDSARDARYVEILLAPLRKCGTYLPKMGGSGEVDLAGFTAAYGADPLYHWMGLDSPLMFAAHKAAGGMTSIYRQLGIGSERLFRQVLRDELNLTADQVKWSYKMLPELDAEHANESVKARVLSLDGRVELEDLEDQQARERVEAWIEVQRRRLNITAPLKGAVFEVRQGYKSADSKRQNADLANAAQALGHQYLPVLVIMSTQINEVVHARYTTGNWSVLMGTVGASDPVGSTYDFLDQVVGYDLAAFFERNKAALRAGTEGILTDLLEAR
uniref:MluI n=1 Tax=Micrococcus luteus TaxID=1270 RepID=G3EST6_MICLU|nr:MluI [Micrococcus luteus]